MKTTTPFQNLSRQIEQVIQKHIAASHRAAVVALEQGFASATGARITAPRALRSDATARRREPAEITTLGELFYRAICARPGETMTVLAAEVGARVRDLHQPMIRLKRAGQIRSVGERHLTRYFPLAS